MTALGRRERLAVWLWLTVAVVVWNGLYDLLLARSTQTYLFKQALHQAGLGPWVDLSSALEAAVRDAVWLSTLWACLLLLAGMVTIRFIKKDQNKHQKKDQKKDQWTRPAPCTP